MRAAAIKAPFPARPSAIKNSSKSDADLRRLETALEDPLSHVKCGPTAGLYVSFMSRVAIKRRTFTVSGHRTAFSSGSRTMLDLIYLVSGCAIFVAFGLYALVLKRV
jgi:hypothetical protein